MSKYSPLADFLRALPANEVRLSFEEIERKLGSPLPPSAHIHPTWWSNADRNKNGWSNLWKRAGWVRSKYNLSEKWVSFQRTHKGEHFTPESAGAHEGYKIDRRLLASKRNARLANNRRQLDNYTCQVCDFRFEISGSFVIDVHHLNPFAILGGRITKIEHLVSLCPTCHRIAHLRKPPYKPEEIKLLRNGGSQKA